MILSVGAEPQVVLDCRNNLGESVVWDDRTQHLWWVNIHEAQIWSWAPFAGKEPNVFQLDERVGAIALREKGGIAAALQSGFALFDPATGAVEKVADIEAHLSTTRLNDGRVDPAGRFVCGGMDESKPQQPISAVYALEADGTDRRIIEGVTCSNSICWSPDGATLYFTDMPTRRIDAFDYDVASGTAANRRLFVDLSREPGFADGSTVDAEGYLWNAQWGGRKVVRYAPNGKVDREIELPIDNPTCLAFGGPDLDILFITSAWFGVDEAARAGQIHAGSIFALRPGVRGRLENRYAG
jgi:L-arabinonolactonase